MHRARVRWYVAVALTFLLRLNVCCGVLNLYLQSSEVFRLLGLKAELFYVRNGQVNDYALGFEMMVPANISELFFTWQNLRPTVMSYAINITSNNKEALSSSHLNISNKGDIPFEQQVFRVVLVCSGKANAEVDVQINLNITMTPSNTTELQLRRKKICLQEEAYNGTFSKSDRMAMADVNSYVFVAVGCVTGLVGVLAALTAVYYLVMRRKHRHTDTISYERTPTAPPPQTFLRVDTPNNSSITGSYTSYRRVPSSVTNHQDDIQAKELKDQIGEILVDKRCVRIQTKLQEGTFGLVYAGLLTESIAGTINTQYVMIKTVSGHASPAQVSLLLSEGMRMFGTNHHCVLPILSVCMDNPIRPMLIYPLCSRGNLKTFLLSCKTAGECHSLRSQDLVSMAVELVEGMIYLHQHGIIHRDLAARNCVVDEWLHVKISDNALARDLFPHDYHCLGDNENRPVKWLAYESLVYRDFSTASDVWAFGVTLWELMTLGQQPYLEIDPFEMDAYLLDGYRLTQPVNCPDQLYTVMAYCWAMVVEDRPNFTQLAKCLQDFSSTLGCFI